MVKKSGSSLLLEGGGKLICFRHDFETTDLEDWNNHCDDGDHFEKGNTICTLCGERIEYEGLPYHRFDATGSKNISLRCDECDQKMKGSAKIVKLYE